MPLKAGIYWFYLNLLGKNVRVKGSIDFFVWPIQQLRPFCHCPLLGLDLQLLPLLGAQVQELGLAVEVDQPEQDRGNGGQDQPEDEEHLKPDVAVVVDDQSGYEGHRSKAQVLDSLHQT